MCTAISITVDNNYFGRNLDFELSFGEKVIITTRNSASKHMKLVLKL